MRFNANQIAHRRAKKPPKTVRKIAVSIGLLLLSGKSQADYQFSPALLGVGSETPATSVDLSLFSDGGVQPPGIYRIDLYLNQESVDTRAITFTLQKGGDGKESLQPCFKSRDLAALGVDTDAFPALPPQTANDCVDLARAIPNAKAEFLFDQQQLQLSIPQAALKKLARGYVSPELWDNGITALQTNYNFTGAQTWSSPEQVNSSSYFLNLRNGVNVGSYRLRNNSVWSRDDQGNTHWNSQSTYLQRDIVPLRSQLTLGDTNTPSDIFDRLLFRGVQLASVDEMYPDSLRGYSPVVRGIAKSNAQVIIRQNNQIIDQRYVPPGAFDIADLYAMSGSGDLNVTIKESDGSEQNVVVPFASLPVLQREGRLSHSVTLGRYRASSGDGTDQRHFLQSTLIYGLPWGMTLYGGTQLAGLYHALLLGGGKNIGDWGALSLDVTNAWTPGLSTADDATQQGAMWRVRYGKSFVSTGTTITVAGYRYASQGFYTLSQALTHTTTSENSSAFSNNNAQSHARKTLSIQQGLGRYLGSFSLSFLEESYWGKVPATRSVSLGYNGTVHGVSYSLNYSDNQNNSGTDRIISLTISLPFTLWSQNSWLSYGLSQRDGGSATQNLGLSGTALADNNLSWGVSQGYTNQGQGGNTTLNTSYKGSKGQLNMGYSRDDQQQRLNYGLQGGMLLHSDGVTLAQPLSDTLILVKAPGAEGVRVVNNSGVTTDSRGYAVVPYARPYHQNGVALDPATLSNDVELSLTSQNVIPTAGAVVVANYQTRVGKRLMMTLLRPNGEPVPFGAQVRLAAAGDEDSTLAKDRSSSRDSMMVGDGGLVYLTGMPVAGVLQIQWGSDAGSQCQVKFTVSDQPTGDSVPMMEATCR